MNSPLDRRTLLRGAGAALALPWLEAFAPRRGATPPEAPRRMAVLVMPNGVLPSAWTPIADEQGGYTPSFALEPLGELRSKVSVLTGLANKNSFDGDGHYAKVAPLLTGAHIRRTGGRDLENGVSMDQLAAQQLGGQTRLPSLELGCDPIYPVEDLGYSSVYGGTIAWSAKDRPCSKEIAPRRVFDRLFAAQALAADPARRSVLDVVKADADRLARQLGNRDRDKLAEYLDAVRALELRIDAAARAPHGAIDGAAAPPPGVPADYPTHLALMFDLIELAFATDSTRIVTFLMANEVSGRDFSFVDGCAGNFHEFSHHQDQAEKQEPYRRINRWHVEQFAALLRRLLRERDDGSTLLDSSLVVLASAMSDGNAHSPHDLPVLLAGGGDVPQGRLLAQRRDTPLCGLWLAMLRRFGLDLERFGDAERPLF
ncbi:MAG: DUF1552 domain-containing protein [Planctomycetes bacterium]|nr:DUF1552 domain-containing protein [Planctomycetota bacterium]